MMAHPNRDEFWQKRNILPHLKNVAPAVMVVTGWYDAEDLYGSFKTYQAIEKQNPKVNNVLVVGPWAHGGWAGGDGRARTGRRSGRNGGVPSPEIELPFSRSTSRTNRPPLQRKPRCSRPFRNMVANVRRLVRRRTSNR